MAPRKFEGNTKRISASKYWCFTLNNWKKEELDEIINICGSNKYCIGEEIGEKNTPHLQGYVGFDKKFRPFETFPNKRISWRKCKGNLDQNTAYTTKDGIIHSNFYKPLRLLHPDHFYPWQKDIIDLISTPANDRSIYWYWEPTGKSGKTAIAKFICTKYNAIVVSGKSTDCKNGILQYYNSKKIYPEIIIFDIPRCNVNYISYEAMESIKNGLFFSGKYEGGMCIFNCPHVICFANEEPNTNELSTDRWEIKRIL